MSAVEAVATLLTKVLGFAVGAKTYEEMSREKQLSTLMAGIKAAIMDGDDVAADRLLSEYRELRDQQG